MKDKINITILDFPTKPGLFFVGGMGSGKSIALETLRQNYESTIHLSLEIIKKEYPNFNTVKEIEFYNIFKYMDLFEKIHLEINNLQELFKKNNVQNIEEYENKTGITLLRKVISLNQAFFPIHTDSAKAFAFEKKMNLKNFFQNIINISQNYGILFIFIINEKHYRKGQIQFEDVIELHGDQILFNNESLNSNQIGLSTSHLKFSDPTISPIQENLSILPNYFDEDDNLQYLIHKTQSFPEFKILLLKKT